MLKFELITVGSLKEKYLKEATDEYMKRLSGYCSPEIKELKEIRVSDDPSSSEIDRVLTAEGKTILSKITERSYVVVLALEGRSFSSEKLAEHLSELPLRGYSSVTFIIGSSHGLSDEVKRRADLLLSVSQLTFPHQLMRPLCLEIVYRCLSIINGSRYHK